MSDTQPDTPLDTYLTGWLVAADYVAANAEIRRLQANRARHPDATYRPLDDRRHVARERARELTATTLAGLLANASIFVGENDLLSTGQRAIAI